MLTKGLVKKKYNTMLIACLLSWIVALLGGLTDGILAGMNISEDAVSAVGLVDPIYYVTLFLGTLLAFGVSNNYSVHIGAFDSDKAYRVNGMGIAAALILGIGVFSLLFFGEDIFFNFYTVSPEIEALAREYYEGLILLFLLYPVYWTVYYLVLADGAAWLVLITDIISAVSNLVLSAVLVKTMGVRGLAYGTCFSLIASGLILLIHFFSRRNSLKFKLCFDVRLLRDIVVSGSTVSLASLYIGVVDIVMNKFIILYFDDVYLAAYTVINLILSLMLICQCAADAAGPFIGVGFGERNPVLEKRMLRICTKDTALIGGILSVLFFAGADFVPSVYGFTTSELCSAAVYSVRVLALSCIVTGFLCEWMSYLPKINKALPANLIAFSYTLLLPLLLAIPFGRLWEYRGMVWGFFLTPFVTFALAAAYICIKYGRKAFPFAIEETGATVFTHELAVNSTELAELREVIQKEAASFGLPPTLVRKIDSQIAESFRRIMEENRGAKQVLAECTLIIDDTQLRLIVRDNGKVFEGTREADDAEQAAYLTAVSFNRSVYLWTRP